MKHIEQYIITTLTQEGIIMALNRRVCRPLAEVVDHSAFDFVAKRDRIKLQEAITRANEQIETTDLVLQLELSPGLRPRRLSLTLCPITIEASSRCRLMAAGRLL